MNQRLLRRVLPLLLGLALGGAVLGTPTREAKAQIIPRSLEVDLFGGYYWYVSNLENLRSAPILGVRLGINFLENWVARSLKIWGQRTERCVRRAGLSAA